MKRSKMFDDLHKVIEGYGKEQKALERILELSKPQRIGSEVDAIAEIYQITKQVLK